jgi:tetratricopeptide (TPR) repeat protein
MTRGQKTWLVLSGVAVAASLGGGWYFYQPIRERARAERALADDDLPAAEALLTKLVRGRPADVHTQFLHARLLRRQGKTWEAVTALRKAIKLGLPESEVHREMVLLQAGQDLAPVEQRLRQALDQDPTDADVLEALTKGYARARRWADAEEMCTRWLAVRPGRVDVLFERGWIRQEAKKFDKATEDLREVVHRRPEDYDARLLYAHCLLTDARIKETEAELEFCRLLRPERAEPLIGLATCAVERRDFERAQDLLNQALTRDPRSALALHQQGDLYLLRQRYDLAIPVYEQILSANARDKQAHLKLAQALRRRGDLGQAKVHARQFEELDRDEKKLPPGITAR